MSRLKVAILEDSKLLLKDLKTDLESTGLVHVVASSTESEEFIEKVKVADVQALVLDIDLAGDSMSGLDVAKYLNKPVLFVSGKTMEYVHQIEEHNFSSDIPVEHVTKPVGLERLKQVLPKFISRVEQFEQTSFIRLDFANSKGNRIRLDEIVFLETEVGKGGQSGNKVIYFKDRAPERIIDRSFPILESMGLSRHKFITPHKSYRVNASCILKYDSSDHQIEVNASNGNGTTVYRISVSENYRPGIRKAWKSTS